MILFPFTLGSQKLKQVKSISFGTQFVMYIFALSVQVHRDETTVNILHFVTMQAYEGTMLKVNLPVEFKEKSTISFILCFTTFLWYGNLYMFF
jgi:large subunit ribosomal protein L25